MILELIPPSDPQLNQTSEPVKVSELQRGKHNDLIDSMIRFAKGEQGDQTKKVLVGLAAPQVGHLLRIILVDVAADGKGKTGNLTAFINPEITWRSAETNDWYEGCYSAGDITGIVTRPTRVRVRAYDRHGNTVSKEFSGYTARIFQHEADHLNGIRFPDHITDESRLHIVNAGEWPNYRNGEAWRNWPRKASFEKWREIKGT